MWLHRWTRRALWAGLSIAWAAWAWGARADPPAPARLLDGPVPLRIIAPIHGLFYQFTPTPAAGLPAGRSALRMELSESNVLQLPRLTPAQVEPELDFEITRLQIAWERGLTDRWDVGLELPLLSFHSGWMDDPIFQVEEAFDKVKPRRRRETRNQFSFRLGRNGETLFSGPHGGVHMGDAAITTRYVVERGSGWRPTVALRGALKLPTGDRDRTTGSGVADAALALSVDWHRGRWSFWSTTGLTVPLAEVRNAPGFDTEPIGSLTMELGYTHSPSVRLHLQGAMQSAPFDLDDPLTETGLPVGRDGTLTHHIVQLTPAVAWTRAGDGSREHTLFLGLVQDFYSSGSSAADASLFAILRVGF